LAVVVVVAACSEAEQSETSTSAAPANTTTTTTTTADPIQAEFVADVELMRDLWMGERLAFVSGFDEGLAYWAANNYPAMGCTDGDYLQSRFPEGPVDGFSIERVIDELSIVRADGWIVPGGVLSGQGVDGRVYIMSIEATTTAPPEPAEPPTMRNVHVTILEGKAHFFLECAT
jgi:hypothetical protein